ncbi:MAG TPA: hypothetical protein PKO15_04560 [Fibrobacteria bacterium]|nr:hypothetical protein [Fibrobacteria bacterium]
MRIVGFFFKILAGLALAALVAFLFGLVVQHLWNWLMPGLFRLPTIDFWQAFGLVFLSRLLFGNVGGHSHPRPGKWRGKGSCRRDEGWDDFRSSGFFRRWSPGGDPKNLEHFDEWWEVAGESSFEGSRLARCGGWGWWSWWKKEGKPSYDAWLDGGRKG